ncbi:MAG: polyamine aminopropyltransferase [Proteobacteria bacterium]|nr:polyamine aminopropyltransferase [Pseudomonadota bacterium]
MTDRFWFAERGGGNVTIHFRCRREIFSGRSAYQSIHIIETEEFGRILFLDGVTQSAETDEFIYHEALVHPAMLTHPAPGKVCIIGGAEGATLREVYRHPGVRRAVMVDIDKQLVDLCREHLPEWSRGAFEDPRTELRFGDGRAYLEDTRERFDVILVDLSDPLVDSPAVYLFTREFYQAVSDRLDENGVAAFQAGSIEPWSLDLHARMFNTLAAVFPVVLPYPYYQPCFHELHSLILVTKDPDMKGEEMGRRLLDRGLELRYLSPNYLQGFFRVPGYVESAYRDLPEILTDQEPLRLSGTAR